MLFNILDEILNITIPVGILVFTFVPMERVFPAKPGQKFFRPGWRLDMLFLIGQYVIWSGAVFWILAQVDDLLYSIGPVAVQSTVRQWPLWVQAIVVVLASDMLIYWGHRLQHSNEFLWRFHKTHHTAEHLDWLAAHREHPLDTVYTVGLINLPAMILGFPLETIIIVIAFRGVWAIYLHSNVRLNIGPLKYIIGCPELHHWHHDLDRRAGNYANLSPLMDILFGTFKLPDHEPEQFGVSEPSPSSYVGHLAEPLVPKQLMHRQSKF